MDQLMAVQCKYQAKQQVHSHLQEEIWHNWEDLIRAQMEDNLALQEHEKLYAQLQAVEQKGEDIRRSGEVR